MQRHACGEANLHDDAHRMVVLGRASEAVSSVWVRGRLIVHEHKVQTIDVPKLLSAMKELSRIHHLADGPWLQDLEAPYRAAFQLPK